MSDRGQYPISAEAMRQSQCEGKARFDSPALAHAVKKRGGKRAVRGRDAYRCPFCSGWHLGRRN